MGFVNGFLKQLTQPADDENEFYDGADESSKPAAKVKPQPVQTQPAPQPQAPVQQPVSRKANIFERQAPAQTPAEPVMPEGEFDDGEEVSPQGLFSALGFKVGGGKKQQAAAPAPASDSSVVIFAPKSLLDARELRDHLLRGSQTIATLDNVNDADARRILDYMSGIAFAMDANITQISTRAFIIVPANVNIRVNNQ